MKAYELTGDGTYTLLTPKRAAWKSILEAAVGMALIVAFIYVGILFAASGK